MNMVNGEHISMTRKSHGSASSAQNELAKLIGERIRAGRKAKGLTQGELASKVGAASHCFISDLERGKRGKRPNVPLLVKICEILDISFEYLFLGKKEKEQKNK